ncbi:hypothetical protein BX616_008459 [Lobosporangium transversale]|nr:hypothetical protein BX616_008459 [Lobosporangium transversale]
MFSQEHEIDNPFLIGMDGNGFQTPIRLSKTTVTEEEYRLIAHIYAKLSKAPPELQKWMKQSFGTKECVQMAKLTEGHIADIIRGTNQKGISNTLGRVVNALRDEHGIRTSRTTVHRYLHASNFYWGKGVHRNFMHDAPHIVEYRLKYRTERFKNLVELDDSLVPIMHDNACQSKASLQGNTDHRQFNSQALANDHDYHGHFNHEVFKELFTTVCQSLVKMNLGPCKIHMDDARYRFHCPMLTGHLTILQKPQKVKVDLDTMISQLPVDKWPTLLIIFHFVEWVVNLYDLNYNFNCFKKTVSAIRIVTRAKNSDSILLPKLYFSRRSLWRNIFQNTRDLFDKVVSNTTDQGANIKATAVNLFEDDEEMSHAPNDSMYLKAAQKSLGVTEHKAKRSPIASQAYDINVLEYLAETLQFFSDAGYYKTGEGNDAWHNRDTFLCDDKLKYLKEIIEVSRPTMAFTETMSGRGPVVTELYPRIYSTITEEQELTFPRAIALRTEFVSRLQKNFDLDSIPATR